MCEYPTVFPTMRYADANAAIDFLADARDPEGLTWHFGTYQPFAVTSP